jgi:hypothetical protein
MSFNRTPTAPNNFHPSIIVAGAPIVNMFYRSQDPAAMQPYFPQFPATTTTAQPTTTATTIAAITPPTIPPISQFYSIEELKRLGIRVDLPIPTTTTPTISKISSSSSTPNNNSQIGGLRTLPHHYFYQAAQNYNAQANYNPGIQVAQSIPSTTTLTAATTTTTTTTNAQIPSTTTTTTTAQAPTTTTTTFTPATSTTTTTTTATPAKPIISSSSNLMNLNQGNKSTKRSLDQPVSTQPSKKLRTDESSIISQANSKQKFFDETKMKVHKNKKAEQLSLYESLFDEDPESDNESSSDNNSASDHENEGTKSPTNNNNGF